MLVVCSLNRPHLYHPPVRLVLNRTSGVTVNHHLPHPSIKTVVLGGWGGIWASGTAKQRTVFVTLEVLQLIALPRGGSQWARGHSGQEPTLQPGPHPQDAHTQGPKAVISQSELNADSGVNLNQTLPHGSPGKPILLQWKPADLFMETSQAGRYRGKGWKTS